MEMKFCRIAVDIGSMCLVKEVAAVIQSALDANLGKQRADAGKDRKRKARYAKLAY